MVISIYNQFSATAWEKKRRHYRCQELWSEAVEGVNFVWRWLSMRYKLMASPLKLLKAMGIRHAFRAER